LIKNSDKDYVEYSIRLMVSNAKIRSIAKSLRSDVTCMYVRDMLLSNRWRCAQTNVLFEFDGSGRNPWQPSLDRIDNKKGYVIGNVQMVCLIYNLAKGMWGPETLEELALIMSENKLA